MGVVLCLLFLVAATRTCTAFTIPHPSSSSSLSLVSSSSSTTSTSTTALHFFGNAMKNAFANEDDLGPKQNAGISGKGPMAVECKINGKPVKAIANQKVSVVAQQARVKISYSCQAGSCGTCRIKMNGREVRACQATITPKKCDIRTR